MARELRNFMIDSVTLGILLCCVIVGVAQGDFLFTLLVTGIASSKVWEVRTAYRRMAEAERVS